MQDEIKTSPEVEKAFYDAVNAQIDLEIELIKKDNQIEKNRLQPTSN